MVRSKKQIEERSSTDFFSDILVFNNAGNVKQIGLVELNEPISEEQADIYVSRGSIPRDLIK